MSEAVRFGLLGFGNIGVGVARNLHARRDEVNALLERSMALTRIADIDTTTPRDVGFDYSSMLTDDVAQVVEADDIDVVIELIGGYEPARSFVERALRAGKHVVTANKAMLSKYGADLMATAREHGVALLFEASVGGGIPIIRSLQQGLAANELTGVYGIINGTTNYILSQMGAGVSFADALADAQERGYAEPDPTFDIEGIDTAHKTAILAWLAFGRPTTGDEVHAEGLTQLIPEDLAFAAEHGQVVKMLGIARRSGDGSIEARAHPAFIPADSMLAAVNGVYNAVMVDGEPIGPTLFFGQGAGAGATSSAVLSDCMALADSIASGGLAREARLVNAGGDASAPIKPMAEIEGEFYVRSGEDGADLDALTNALEAIGVSVVVSKQSDMGLTQMMTTLSSEGVLLAALDSLEGEQPFYIRKLAL